MNPGFASEKLVGGGGLQVEHLIIFKYLKFLKFALAGVAQWIEYQSANQMGHQFDSQSGHIPGLWTRSPAGGVREATTHRCFSPSLFLSLPLSLKINK